MRTGAKILLGGVAAAAGAFALLLCVLHTAAYDLPSDDLGGGMMLGMLFLASCVGVLPVALLLHGAALLIARKYLQRLSVVGLLHTSFLFPLVPALLAALVRATPVSLWIFYTIPGISLFIGLPAFYILTLVGWLRLLDRTVLDPDPARHGRARFLLAVLLGYGAWAYWPKVPWRKLVPAILIHVAGGMLSVLLLAWFWNEYVDRPLGPIPDDYVPYLAWIPVTLGVWYWAVRDAVRTQIESAEESACAGPTPSA